MKAKILKAQFNKMCLGGLLLDMKTVAIYSGMNGMTNIEVSPEGINIQPGPGNSLSINTMNVKGPGFVYQNSFADFLPVKYVFLPRKTIDIEPLKDIAASAGVGLAFAGFLGAMA